MSFHPAIMALWVLPFLMAVVFHEWAHGYAAERFGDDTARAAGRLTLNPFAHVDSVGTLLVPGFLLLTGAPILFGWAKPVPVAFHRLRNPMRDMVYVAAAGPAMNIALAVASAAVLAVLDRGPGMGAVESGTGLSIAQPLAIMCELSIRLNVLLAVFNMLPIPPLDGGRVAVGLLPRDMGFALARVEPFGFLIVLALLMTDSLDFVLWPAMHTLVWAVKGIFQVV